MASREDSSLHRPSLRSFCAAVFVLAICACSFARSPRATFADSAPDSAAFTRDEARLAGAINAQRIANGLAPLMVDPDLTEVARERSDDQVTRNYFSHTTPDGRTVFDLLSSDGISWAYGGENLAESRGMDPVQTAISGFMQSPAHRDNVLSSQYSRIGVGAAQSADSTTILTVVFAG